VTPSLLMIKLGRQPTLRDRNFRLATATTGRERAEHLHQGITAVAGLLARSTIAAMTRSWCLQGAVVSYHDRPEQAQAAWLGYRAAAKPGARPGWRRRRACQRVRKRSAPAA